MAWLLRLAPAGCPSACGQVLGCAGAAAQPRKSLQCPSSDSPDEFGCSQALGLKPAGSSGALNPTAAEFVPGALPPALAAKISAVNEQLRNPSSAAPSMPSGPANASSQVQTDLPSCIYAHQPAYISFQPTQEQWRHKALFEGALRTGGCAFLPCSTGGLLRKGPSACAVP